MDSDKKDDGISQSASGPSDVESEQESMVADSELSDREHLQVDEEHLDDDELEDTEGDDLEVEQPFAADDPLAPAYDLELGEPISADSDKEPVGLPWRSRVRTAKEFLGTELLYRYDILEPEARRKVAGTVRLDLKGEDGGSWTISLGDELKVEDEARDAELSLSMTHKDFVRLVNGDLNPQLAILAKKVRITGDLKKAMVFHGLLVPANEQ